MDIKVFALIMVATTAVVGGLKKSFAWVSGKEEFLAVVLPVLFTIIAKVAGMFHETDWVAALTWAFGSGLGAGVLHDKFVEPVLQGKQEDKADAK
jgi:hypothetical protein